ncbi:hypothetical protein SDC9_148024 [bioreactor metagenome]|uniref:Uncharacterized protein n=1 Tax=bioreactor metagenome TaxID=1076179 RepID=A0A645EHA0_9ZZZZ
MILLTKSLLGSKGNLKTKISPRLGSRKVYRNFATKTLSPGSNVGSIEPLGIQNACTIKVLKMSASTRAHNIVSTNSLHHGLTSAIKRTPTSTTLSELSFYTPVLLRFQ